MARLILLKDKDPLVIRKAEMKDDEIWICRCGLSAQWPLCDSSHALARREKKATTYQYHRAEPGARLEQRTTDADPAEADPRPGPSEEDA